ncbi:hypothetical protein AB0B89_23705 [Sphaerisporangium sp. NPDC049002]|uniref:hypothetical protein n=1 Tax=Sphaerisporangium sp. NPDC049002 TaxID=3155392 RepID=UPI0033F74DB0
MAKIIRSRSSSLQIRSSPSYQGGMTVWALRDFVRALDAEGVSDKTRVTCDHDHNTRSLTGLWVKETTTEGLPASGALDQPADGEQTGGNA